jgi:lysophospholipase L1-like esterase
VTAVIGRRGCGAAIGLAALLMPLGMATAQPVAPIEPGARYVALGSSYAAGPGIATPAELAPPRCGQSSENYSHLAARALRLALADRSCSGATTTAVLSGWNELGAQIEAVTPETRLVTVTIGGNDVGYVPNLLAAACRYDQTRAHATGAGGRCPQVAYPDLRTWMGVAQRMRLIARTVRDRAPQARLVFVDYPVVLPERGNCPATALPDSAIGRARAIAVRLAALTATVARQEHAELLRASDLTLGHDVCARDPWMNGYHPAVGARGVPYHPVLAGMRAVAEGLVELIHRDQRATTAGLAHGRLSKASAKNS